MSVLADNAELAVKLQIAGCRNARYTKQRSLKNGPYEYFISYHMAQAFRRSLVIYVASVHAP